MQKIAAYGASVTEQDRGYVYALSKRIGCNIKKFGYGGMHLNDAGICFIDNVIKVKPELCIIDWFSTGYIDCSEKTLVFIDTILYKFSNINCACVFLFLPFLEDSETTDKKNHFYTFVKSALDKRDCYYIDIASAIPKKDYISYLRDSIHTTEVGGERYAEIIQQKLESKAPKVLPSEKFVGNALYKNLRKFPVKRVFYNEINLTLNGEIIGIYNIIGRHSGLCSITTDNKSEKILLWDRWCHYERNHFDFSIPQYNGKLEIKILNDTFDTSTCKIPVKFEQYKKQIVCCEIFWQGNELHFNNISDGSKLAYLVMQAIKFFKFLKHIIARLVKRMRCIDKSTSK